MTARAKLKHLIRARMEKTGESYSIAKRNLEAQRLREESDGFTVEHLHVGRSLSEADVATLEQRLEEHPNNISARIRLIGYYFRERRSTSSRSHRRRHTLWFLENHPCARLLRMPDCQFFDDNRDEYQGMRQVLFERLSSQGEDVSSLVIAAAHIQVREKELAATLFAKAHALAPSDGQLAFTLGRHLLLMDQPNAALDALERALVDAKNDEERFCVLGTVAKAALFAKELAKSKTYADELLAWAAKFPTHWNHGNTIHEAHSMLGLLALEAGKVDEACAALLKAGKTPGSPTLNSFGPNMCLAKGLTEHGQTTAVLEYFELCSHFWKMGADRLKSWASIVESGGQPDFGPNLRY